MAIKTEKVNFEICAHVSDDEYLVVKGFLEKKTKQDHFEITERGSQIYLRDKALCRL